jgi:hypothetical protein
MANLCCNYITIQGNPEILDIIAQDYIGYDKEKDSVEFNFGIMSPIPYELLGDDYRWRIENWGNKWDGSDCYIDICDDQIYLNVETAWSPCDKWTYKLIELCPGVDIYHEYYEPGEGYIGWIQHFENEGPEDYEEVCYNFSSDSYDYWLTVFEKEYETFDWLAEHIEEMLDDETITKAEADEALQMIDDDTPLETLIARCIELDIL